MEARLHHYLLRHVREGSPALGAESMGELQPPRVVAYCFILLFLFTVAACGGGGSQPATPSTPSKPQPGPSVASTLPSAGATGVATNTAVAVAIDEPINQATVNGNTISVVCAGTNEPGTLAYDPTNQTIVIHFSAELPPNTTCTVTLSTGVEDTSGQHLAAPVTLTFSTGAAPDLTAPAITSAAPAPNATGVPLTAKITVQFSKPMDPTFLNGQTSTGVVATYSYDPATFKATVVANAPLQPNTSYKVTVSGTVKDMTGNALGQDVVWQFTTGN